MKTGRRDGVIAWASYYRDGLWCIVWIVGVGLLWLWDVLFLNKPALARLETAFVNTMIGGIVTVTIALAAGWGVGVALHFLERKGQGPAYLTVMFGVNVLRSVPQIIGILAGDVVLTILIQREILAAGPPQLVAMAAVIAVFVFLEVTDLVRERIAYHESLDFVPAMRCCGISEGRIVNKEILWKNSRVHLLHKAIALFGTVVFLQCSIDFIISVGLSTDVSSANFPVSLGSLLAKMDSKQDVLAIGTLFTDPLYVQELAVRHLQGLSVAFLIVFTLICVYKIANGTIRRYRL